MTLRFPRRTARLRLTVLYGVLFLLSGATLVAGTYVLFEQVTASRPPHLPKIPRTPAIQSLQPPLQLAHALYQLKGFQIQLAQDQHRLSLLPRGAAMPPLLHDRQQLTRDQHQLTRDQHRLTHAVQQLAQASSAQAAQRAADSHQLLVDSGIALAVVGLLALLVGWLVAGRMLRPIRTITRTARRISSSSLHERLALEGPADELKELGDTLDELFARLEASFEAQRRFVANASHELRTPLTRERALVQVALGDPSTSDLWRSTGQELLASNREQESLLEALLTLASSEGGIDQHEPVDLSGIARTVISDRRDSDLMALHIDATLESAPLDGEVRLLESLVANLVDNAVTHNVEGGSVHVSTATDEDRAVLSVINTGPLVPAAELDRLFQPFQRLDPGRSHRGDGHGLGLSIVRAIADGHGATITAQPLPDGGVSIEVAFPPPSGVNGLVLHAPTEAAADT